jgi:hypothetical protein
LFVAAAEFGFDGLFDAAFLPPGFLCLLRRVLMRADNAAHSASMSASPPSS